LRLTGGLGAAVSTNDVGSALDNTDRVMLLTMPNGRLQGTTSWMKGQYSAGWPAYSSFVPFGRTTGTTTTYTTSSDTVTGLPRKLVLFGQSGTSAKSYTIARIRLDYMVR
jgi:hypothetical protein